MHTTSRRSFGIPTRAWRRPPNGRFVEKGESYAQLVSANGAVVEFDPPAWGKAPVLTPAELTRAVHHVIFGNEAQYRASTSRRGFWPRR